MPLVFITITAILQLQIKGCVGCLETERIGLLHLKSYLNSLRRPQDENILKSWSQDASNSDCCLWERVKCNDSTGGHIVDLSLNQILRIGASGSLNLSLLHSFPQLKTLDFSTNGFDHLFDPIHGYKSFQRLEKLRNLKFYGNRLNNCVLPFLSVARSLRTLNLGFNEMKGVFPPNGLTNLRELEVLDLSRNNINDSEAYDGLRTTKLKTLDLSFNSLSVASRLNALQGMSKLQELDLTANEFSDLDSLGVLFPSSLQVLKLRSNQLSSTLKGYSKICALKNLQELDLRFNALKNLPYCLVNLTGLQILDLLYNQLNGNLSSFVCGLPSTLESLPLLHNNFNGSFRFSSLVNNTRLAVFTLSSEVGKIQAQAESSWVPLFQLKMLKLQNVILDGPIPDFLIYQRDLWFIDISYGQLTGAFPTWLVQNNTGLQIVFLNNNSLTEFRLPRLANISSNRIQDSVQEDIGIVFPKMRYMDFSSNHFYGTIPSSMGEMKSLRFLDMSSNSLYGQLRKAFLSSCYSLAFLKLSNNQFQGRIFPEYANLTGLDWLFLDGNNFSESLGRGLLNSKHLTLLDLSDNNISGTLPFWIGRMSILQYLYMRGNQLNGRFPLQLQNLSQLNVIDISHNSFSGSIPRNLDFPFLTELRLQSNEFMGSIPDRLFEAEELEVLDLRNNKFSGMILSTNDKSSSLLVFLLGNNSFQSYIPKKICEASQVSLLDLSHNKFKGDIPSCLGNMSFGAERANRTGSFTSRFNSIEIPSLPNWSYTSAFDLDDGVNNRFQVKQATIVDFLTKNRYEAYQGDIIGDMHGLDLSSNELSGEIPIEIGNLESIRSLNFSSNRLTGSIPEDSISKLKDLESLDLSSNKLDGNIPPQLAGLNSLGYFNVSFNNLSGEIPLNGHLLTFDEKSYLGNAHLCGPPTNKSCNPVPEPKQAKEEEEESDGVIDMVWFYWTCGAVYISTLLALSVFLCIDSRWSREWFYRVDLLVHHLHRFKGRLFSN